MEMQPTWIENSTYWKTFYRGFPPSRASSRVSVVITRSRPHLRSVSELYNEYRKADKDGGSFREPMLPSSDAMSDVRRGPVRFKKPIRFRCIKKPDYNEELEDGEIRDEWEDGEIREEPVESSNWREPLDLIGLRRENVNLGRYQKGVLREPAATTSSSNNCRRDSYRQGCEPAATTSSPSSDTSRPTSRPKITPRDSRPTKTKRQSWRERCKDAFTIARREKEIAKAKEKPIYAEFKRKFPNRQGREDLPRTPRKEFSYSRRSWDSQMKIWKKALYVACGQKENDEEAERSGHGLTLKRQRDETNVRDERRSSSQKKAKLGDEFKEDRKEHKRTNEDEDPVLDYSYD